MAHHDNNNQRCVPRSAVPKKANITNLNGLLADIYVRYVQLKIEDFQLHYRVFSEIFLRMHKSMKEIDPYYNQYSSTIQFAGSHYDRLRIKKPDEFDVDIVIGMPLNIQVNSEDPNQSDFMLQPQGAGYIQMQMGVQFNNLPIRDASHVNKTAYEWGDNKHFLLQSNFKNWFKGLVIKALNARRRRTFHVDGIPYTVRTSQNGPAVTLIIENRNRGFRLDIDLVPALRVPESRWPVYRRHRPVPLGARRDYWMLVPKPNKAAGETEQTRSWRISLQIQERDIMHDLYNCKPTIRMLKKLRDSQNMKHIASYYVKTLFLWEIEERDDPDFWRNSPAELFKIMVTKFYNAMVLGDIPDFWTKDNLIAGVKRVILNDYADKLARLLQVLEKPAKYKQVAKYLLSRDEFLEYKTRFLHI